MSLNIRDGIIAVLLCVSGVLLWMVVKEPEMRSADSVIPDAVESGEDVQSSTTELPLANSGQSSERDESLDKSVSYANSEEESPPRVVYASSIDYLEEFWGDRWPAMREELLNRVPERLARYEALVLTENLIPPPLSEIHDEIVKRFLAAFDSHKKYLAWRGDAEAWPDPITLEFLEEKLGYIPPEIGVELISVVQQISDAYSRGLDDARRKFFDAAMAAVEREAIAGAYAVWPLVMSGAGMDPRTGESSTITGNMDADVTLLASYRGLWAFQLKVLSADYPQVHDLRLEMDKLGKARLTEARIVVMKMAKK